MSGVRGEMSKVKRRRLFSFYFLPFTFHVSHSTCISSGSTWQSVSAIDLKTVIRGVDVRAIEDTAVIEWLLTRPERNGER